MALQMEWEAAGLGLTLAAAYLKVRRVVTSKENGIEYQVAVFADSDARDAHRDPVEVIVGHKQYDDSCTDNAIKDIYEYLKAQDEYSGAEDV